MNDKKTIYTILAVICVFLTVALACRLLLGLCGSVPTAAKYSGRVIIIDPGHGAFDPGAQYGGIDEKDINLVIAHKLADLFRANGYVVVMTRTDDSSTSDEGLNGISEQKRSDIRNRVALANSFLDAVYISIHQNAFEDASQAGPQVLYGTEHPNSKSLAQSVYSSMRGILRPTRTREIKRGTKSINILINVKCPIVLAECGFMSNSAELALLTSDEYAAKVALSIFFGYIEYEIIELNGGIDG